jgi:copper homeostasis protein (lipoprotein)
LRRSDSFRRGCALGLLAAALTACMPREPVAPDDIGQRFQGLYRYYADSASLQDCASGRTYPILVEGGHLQLERAWLAASPVPESRRLVEFDAVVELRAPEPGLAPREHLRVTRFISLADATDCGGEASSGFAGPPSLRDTAWRVLRLDGKPIAGLAPAQSPTLQFSASERRVAGYTGCNRFAGSYELNGTELRFSQLATTRMACVGEAGIVEQVFSAALDEIHTLRLTDQRLELFDKAGTLRIAAQSAGD